MMRMETQQELTEDELETWWMLHSNRSEKTLTEWELTIPWATTQQQDNLRHDFALFAQSVPVWAARSPSFSVFLAKRPLYLQTDYLKNVHCPDNVTLFFARNGDKHVKLAITKIPDAVPDALATLACDPDAEVRKAAVSHSRLPESSLGKVLEDPEPEVRVAAAAWRNLPPDTLLAFGHDPCAKVRQVIAGRPECPDSLVCELAEDEDLTVKETVATRAWLPSQAVNILCTDVSPKVRKRVVLNRSVDVEQVKRMVDDEAKTVRLAAVQRIKNETGKRPDSW